MGKPTGEGKCNVKVGSHSYANMISKPATVRRGEYKCRKWELHLKLRDQQLTTTLYTYRLLYQTSWEMQMKKLQRYTHKKEKAT